MTGAFFDHVATTFELKQFIVKTKKIRVVIMNRHLFQLLFLVLSVFSTSTLAQKTLTLSSPDKLTTVHLSIQDGRVNYRVTYDDKEFIEPSALGLHTSIGDFSKNLTLKAHQLDSVSDHYQMANGKKSEVHYRANRLLLTLQNSNNDVLDIEFHASNNNVAYRYGLTSQAEATRVKIEKEATSFNLPANATTFITSQALPETGWMQTKPSYEEPYTVGAPVSQPSANGVGYTFPALFKIAKQGWVLLSESGVDSRYVGSRLGEADRNGVFPLEFPQSGENSGIGATSAAMALPAKTPWRTITIGHDLAPIVETTIPFDLVKQRYPAKYDYNLGRATWSWIVWQDDSINYQDQIKYIDLAAELQFEYVLIDNWWDARIGRDKIEQLAKYAKAKNVELMLWYNSNGWWNDAPQTPQDIMNLSSERKREMAWMQKIGIKGIKVDFFGGDKQDTMKLYEEIFTDANDHNLLVTVHGSTFPRGWERMFPNFVTSEAVLASENLIFFQNSMDQHALNATILPFTRNAVGAMDFAPVFLNQRLSKQQTSGTIRRTTDAFELATSIIYQSPIQHFGLTPNNLNEQPQYVLDFLKRVPAHWDDTVLLSGEPADHVAIARRNDENWYVGVANGKNSTQSLTISAPMLAGKNVVIIEDKNSSQNSAQKATISNEDLSKAFSSREKRMQVPANGKIVVTLASQGGAVIYTLD